MLRKKLIVLSGLVLGFAPLVVLAQIGTSGTTSSCDPTLQTTGSLLTLLCKIGQLLNAVIPVLIALGVLYFIWCVVSYVIASDEEAKKKGISNVVFDRNGFLYHGRVQALADGAREGGLKF